LGAIFMARISMAFFLLILSSLAGKFTAIFKSFLI
jgi:hypothetical protein